MNDINTYGWDMVLACKTSLVNSSLTGGDDNINEVVKLAGQTVTAKGDTGCWQITTGGSDALVNFSIPCSKLSLDNGKKTVSFKKGEFLVQARLELALQQRGISELKIVTGKSCINVLDASFPENDFSQFRIYAQTACQQWLDTLKSVDYILASIQLSPSGVETPSTGLIPESATYAYSDSAGSGGVLGLLCSVIGGSGTVGNLQQINPDAIQSGESAILVNADIVQRWLQTSVSSTTWGNQTGIKADIIDTLDYSTTLNNKNNVNK